MAAVGVGYLRITLLTLSVFIAGQIFASVLTGAGDATTPLIVTLITTPVGIGAQWVLTFGHFGFPALGIGGIAWGAAMGAEFAAKGANVQLGPGMNVMRTPYCGRTFEYVSGDNSCLYLRRLSKYKLN